MKRLITTAILIILFLGIFSRISDILEYKSLAEPWNMTLKVGGFYNEPEDSMDILFFGSSHMYCSIDPNLLEEQTGLTSYIFATQKQPLWITYHYMIEALKTQKPKKIFLEVNMATEKEDYMDEGTNYSAIDPIQFSINKWNMIQSAALPEEQHQYLFNIIKYHDRWQELTPQDYDLSYKKEQDPLRGYVKLVTAEESAEFWDLSQVTEIQIPTAKNIEYLNKMIDLSKEESFELIMFKSPSSATEEEKKIYNYVADLCQQNNIKFVDFNMHYDEIGLNPNIDYYDKRHLNIEGMKKFLPYFISTFLEEVPI